MDEQSPINALISAIIAGVVSYVTAKKHDTSSYVKDQKILWQSKIRHIAKDLYLASYKKTLKLLSELKTYINPIGHNDDFTNEYSYDAHIWELIDEMESTDFSNSKKLLHVKQNQLIEYLSLLLKYDWENSKVSFFYNINYFYGFLMLLASAIAYIVSFLSNNIGIAKSLFFIIISYYFTWAVILLHMSVLDSIINKKNFEKHPKLLQKYFFPYLQLILNCVTIIPWFGIYYVGTSSVLCYYKLSINSIAVAPGLASYFIGFGMFYIGIFKKYLSRYTHIYTIYKIKDRYKNLTASTAEISDLNE